MGCEMSAFLDLDEPTTETLLERVPIWFDRWEKRFSRFQTESELVQVNRQAGEWTSVSAEFWEVLLLAVGAYQTSGGLVSPAVLPSLLDAGYTQSFNLLDLEQSFGKSIEHALRDPDEIEFDADNQSIHLPWGMQLDFGGIAKGWAAQQAVRRLEKYGPTLVNAGGDLAVGRLQQGGQPWQVGIADPFHEGDDLEVLGLAGVGVATSGSTRRRWRKGGIWQHHIIDPRTGLPAESDIVGATVIARDSVGAEIGAKTLLILGSQAGMAWVEEQPELYGMAVLKSGEVIYDSVLAVKRRKYVYG
jgi:thiamine biosynthesis lipoprotein